MNTSDLQQYRDNTSNSTTDTTSIIPRSVSATPVLRIKNVKGETVAEFQPTSRLLQQQMLKQSVSAFLALKDYPENKWFELIGRVGLSLDPESQMDNSKKKRLKNYTKIISGTTGLPEVRVRHSLISLSKELSSFCAILAAQNECDCGERTERESSWRRTSAGRNVLVRVPGNFPTININWLMALGFRRPVLLCPTLSDPFTCGLLSEIFYEEGLPKGSISISINDAPAWVNLADQILWSGAPLQFASPENNKLRTYHQGQSKAIILDSSILENSIWERLTRMIVRGCGRLCTNLSTVLVTGQAEYVATQLAERLAAYKILPLDHKDAIIPAFNSPETLNTIIKQLELAKRRGAIDISERLTGLKLLQEIEGVKFLRPTVLMVNPDDELYGAELPFPFVTVATADKSEFVELCKNSLTVSVIGNDYSLLERLLIEPKIDKLFYGDHFDHDYTPYEPHQGYLIDFLFKKKAVYPNII